MSILIPVLADVYTCNSATGRTLKTRERRPDWFHSEANRSIAVYAVGGQQSEFGHDLLAVYNEDALLPYAVVSYTFRKKTAAAQPPPAHSSNSGWLWEDGGHVSGQTGGSGQTFKSYSKPIGDIIETAFLLGKNKVAFCMNPPSQQHGSKTFMFQVRIQWDCRFFARAKVVCLSRSCGRVGSAREPHWIRRWSACSRLANKSR